MAEFVTIHMLKVVAIIAAGGCAVSVSYLFLTVLGQARVFHQAQAGEVLLTDTTSPWCRAFLPVARTFGLALRYLLAGQRQTGVYPLLLLAIRRELSAAGNPQGIDPDEYVGFGILLALLGGLGGAFLHIFGHLDKFMSIYTCAWISSFLGALWWKAWLSGQKTRRQTEIRKLLPFALDLLTLAMEAGLDFTSALMRIVSKMEDSPLGQEFSLTLREIQLGKARSNALRDFAIRVDVPEVRTVIASLIQAEELGASLGPVLRIQAAQQRERRSQRAEETAMKAPVKMLFPLTLFIFPNTLIIIFTPIVIRILG